MENNNEKKAKRPRIGQPLNSDAQTGENTRYERIDHSEQGRQEAAAADHEGGYQPRQYQPRPYNNRYQRPYQRPYNNYNNQDQDGQTDYNGQRQGGYNQGRYNQGGYNQGGYNNRQGGYNRPYNNRYNRPYNNHYNNNRPGGYNNNQYQQREDFAQQSEVSSDNADGAENMTQQPQQQYRPYNNRQGGYNNNRYNNRQGGYNNRQGGYNNRPGGYQNRRQVGGYNHYNNRPGGFHQAPRPGKSFTPRPRPVEYETPVHDPEEEIRLNKYMANAGICSRREADEFIQQGLVKVNGEVVTELGTKITYADTIEYDDKVVTLQNKCYILLNKPKNCVTTSDDPNGRTTVLDLVKGACNERIYPVGRLDRNTTGVLLLTNDGDLASKLTHPKFVKKKIYHVWTDKDITEDDMQRIADGIELDDGPIHADAISYATENDRNQAGIEIHSGRNRIVRRIFESLGYHVTKLDRVYFAGLTKKNLPRGRWRYLTQEEVNYLKMGSFE